MMLSMTCLRQLSLLLFVCFVLVEFGNMAKHTFVDKVFGGVFISSVLCHVCHVVRIICSVSCLSRDLLCFCLISSMCLVIYLSQLYLHTSQLVLQSCVLCACCLLGCFQTSQLTPNIRIRRIFSAAENLPGKNAAAVNTAKFVKLDQPLQKLQLTFS